MRSLVVVLLAVALMRPCLAGAAPRVAAVYSSWSNYTFRSEFDPAVKQLGWQLTKYENTAVQDLVAHLADTDVVVVCSTGNYEHTQDLAPYRQQWLDYLQRGGILLVVDANYDSVLGAWISKLGPDFALSSKQCAPVKAAEPATPRAVFNPTARLLVSPNDLKPELTAKPTWAHMEGQQAVWTSAVDCADGKSLLLYRRVGNGLIALCSYASFNGPEGQRLASHLLENMLVYTRTAATGFEVLASQMPQALPGVQHGYITVRNTGSEGKSVSIRMTAEPAGYAVAPTAAPVKVGAGRQARIPFTVDFRARGAGVVSADVLVDGQPLFPIVRQLNVPQALTFSTAQRHLYNASRVAFTAQLAPDGSVSLRDCSLKVQVDGSVVKTVTAPALSATLPISTRGLALGLHTAQAQLVRKGVVIATASTEFVLNPTPRIHSRADGVLTIDGKPEFPFGWYHVSWGSSMEDKLQFLRAIGSAGFNVAHMSCDRAEDWRTVLDEARKQGIRIITEFGGDYPALIKTYKEHPAVMAWNPGDEPDGQGISPEEMLRRANSFRDVDPHHPAYMVLCVPSTYARYAGSADIIAPDIYPIPGGKVSDVHRFLLAARNEAAKHQRPIWAVVQCFGYANASTWRVPTVDECRNMTYQALLAGAKGIIYYTYYDNGFAVQKFPELWKGMQDLVPEINALKPYLVSANPVMAPTQNPDLLCGIWTKGRSHIAVVVNTSAQDTAEVDIALPGTPSAAPIPLYARDAQNLTAQRGRLTGKLRPLGAAVFTY